jgi:hypothetical protein
MAIYSRSTFNYSASQAIKDQMTAGIAPIIQPYVTAGVCLTDFTHTPALPDGKYPPATGEYMAQRSWTDLGQAQTCIAAVNAWLDANPECKAYNYGPTVVQV